MFPESYDKLAPFFSIKSLKALQSGGYGILRGNIENTPENISKALSIFDTDFYCYEFHYMKYEM